MLNFKIKICKIHNDHMIQYILAIILTFHMSCQFQSYIFINAIFQVNIKILRKHKYYIIYSYILSKYTI